jgi:hypothetical protein
MRSGAKVKKPLRYEAIVDGLGITHFLPKRRWKKLRRLDA